MKKNILTEVMAQYGMYDECEFEIDGCRFNPCTLTNGNVRDRKGNDVFLNWWAILTGEADVTVLPWEPKEGDDYWYFDWEGDAISEKWEGNFADYTNLKAGNFARTEAELLSRKDEIMRNIGMTKEE